MTQIPQNSPTYMAAKSVTTGAAPSQFYTRFRAGASRSERDFVDQATAVFFEEKGFKIQSVSTLFPAGNCKPRKVTKGTRIENVFLVSFTQDCGASRFPNGLIVQSRALASEQSVRLGAKTFAELQKLTDLDFVQPVQKVNDKRQYVAKIEFNGAINFVYAHPYIEGRPPYLNDVDMGRVGKAVAALEIGISQFPESLKKEVCAASKPHNQSLCRAAWYLLENQEWLRATLVAQESGDKETTKKIVRICDDYIQWQENQKPSALHHINLIPNHVLMQSSGKIAILDCTRLRDGFLPPHMDLGQIAARMLTCPTSIEGKGLAPEKQRGALECLLAGYNNAQLAHGRDPSSLLTYADLKDAMVRSLVLTKLLPQVTLVEREPERAAKMTAYYGNFVTQVMRL